MFKFWKWLLLGAGLLFLIAAFSLSQTPALILAALGKDAIGNFGFQKHHLQAVERSLGSDGLDQVRSEAEMEVRAALDCSTVPPQERRPGVNCIEGLLAGEGQWSAVPKDKEWLVGIWKKAAREHNLPWELLASISGQRSAWGRADCTPEGFYRQDASSYRRSETEAGGARVEKQGSCWSSEGPAKVGERYRSAAASPHDPVDSTFTIARALERAGAAKEWKYNGSKAKTCLPDGSDGRLWPAPVPPSLYGPGARIGWNKNLRLPRWAPELAAEYRSDKGKYRPRRDTPDPNYSPMPKKDIVRLLTVAWEAFGARGEELRTNVTKNYSQIGMESGGRPYIMQGYIGDVNDNNPAGGLFQFIPSTFDHWNVDGFNDRFNPLDNILAAVNAQVNGPYYILDGSMGWSPPFSDNPYATGGKVELVGSQTVPQKPPKVYNYKGPRATDSTSRALERVIPGSPCSRAMLWQWYQVVKRYPPLVGIYIDGPGGTQKIIGGGKLVPCPRSIPQDTGNPCYIDRRIIPNLRWLHRTFGIYISDGYSGPLPGGGAAGCFASGYQCHSVAGEHPLGLGVDIVPVPGKDWRAIDRLAKWAEPEQGSPRKPFRWVGYDGDANHGSGHHLHLSWDHSVPAIPYRVTEWVLVFKAGQKDDSKPAKPVKPAKPAKPPEPANPTSGGRILRGKVSWFEDSVTASGISAASNPGLALNLRPGTDSGWNNDTTQGWIASAREGRPMCVRVTLQGRSLVMPVLDLGPAGWTERAIDISVPGIKKMGWSQASFPTDARGKAQILGRGNNGTCKGVR